MSRGCKFLISILLAGIARSQQPPVPKPPDKPQQEEELQLPPEEDKAKIPKEYSFNPVQSKKEVTVGEFYFKKRDFKAAAGRFREATKWNDGNAEAWLRLGDSEDKLKDFKAAREAWEKFLQLAPDGKISPEVRKKLAAVKN
jgi:tetratricopeptide (TPR) repeat protein